MNAVFNLKWLIRGYGKRVVVVYARDVDFSDDTIPPAVVDEICQTMASLASANGWKKIVIIRGRDQFNGPFKFIGTNMAGLTNAKFHRVFSVVIDPGQTDSISNQQLDNIW